MFIGFIYHRGFMWEFYEILCFLSHYCYTFEVLRIHVRVLWDHSLLRSLLIYLWMWEMNNLLLGSPDHCLFHHSIIGDMTFLFCIGKNLSSFILLSLCLSMFSHYLFPDSCSTFLFLSYIITCFWFDTFFALITTQKVLFCTFNSLCFKHFCVVVLHLYSNWHVKDLAMTSNHIGG